MFGKNYVTDLIERSAENPADRRRFMKSASAAALGVVRAGPPGSVAEAAAPAQDNANAISDGAILNSASSPALVARARQEATKDRRRHAESSAVQRVRRARGTAL